MHAEEMVHLPELSPMVVKAVPAVQQHPPVHCLQPSASPFASPFAIHLYGKQHGAWIQARSYTVLVLCMLPAHAAGDAREDRRHLRMRGR